MALLNLAVNARDAMPDGGSLRIEADEACEAIIGDLPGGRYLRLRLTDSGQGMDAETLERAVDPFYTTKGVGKGTGLGLSMVQGLAHQSGGVLRLESEPGRGTTAEILLPVAQRGEGKSSPDATPDATPEAQEEPTSRRLKVLVVDDDALVADGHREHDRGSRAPSDRGRLRSRRAAAPRRARGRPGRHRPGHAPA